MIESFGQLLGFAGVFVGLWLLWCLVRFFLAPGGFLDAREEARDELQRQANIDPEHVRREAVAAHIERNRAEHALWEHHWNDYTGRPFTDRFLNCGCGDRVSKGHTHRR